MQSKHSQGFHQEILYRLHPNSISCSMNLTLGELFAQNVGRDMSIIPRHSWNQTNVGAD